jgi:hypothetical protein
MMENWKGIVGKGFSPDDFEIYASVLKFQDWHPRFIVLHNTEAPKLSQWHSVSGEQRMKNLEDFYRNTQKWSAGPHLFVADDLIWVFTPLTTSGVHSPSWNSMAWGVEMVGDYSVEDFDDRVRDNAVSALATLHALLNLNPETLRLHKEDPKTRHDCPGKNVDKADIVQRVVVRLQQRRAKEHLREMAG